MYSASSRLSSVGKTSRFHLDKSSVGRQNGWEVIKEVDLIKTVFLQGVLVRTFGAGLGKREIIYSVAATCSVVVQMQNSLRLSCIRGLASILPRTIEAVEDVVKMSRLWSLVHR